MELAVIRIETDINGFIIRCLVLNGGGDSYIHALIRFFRIKGDTGNIPGTYNTHIPI